MIYIYI